MREGDFVEADVVVGRHTGFERKGTNWAGEVIFSVSYSRGEATARKDDDARQRKCFVERVE